MVVTIKNGLAALAVPLYYTVDAQRAFQKTAYRSVDLITPTHLVNPKFTSPTPSALSSGGPSTDLSTLTDKQLADSVKAAQDEYELVRHHQALPLPL
ncbi:MAG: hypothetical protein LQ349_008847 [Xanthoria aureola]|nr:MAG: hypothetical protein LQ349_008847 [Xanthoria aureola]